MKFEWLLRKFQFEPLKARSDSREMKLFTQYAAAAAANSTIPFYDNHVNFYYDNGNNFPIQLRCFQVPQLICLVFFSFYKVNIALC